MAGKPTHEQLRQEWSVLDEAAGRSVVDIVIFMAKVLKLMPRKKRKAEFLFFLQNVLEVPSPSARNSYYRYAVTYTKVSKRFYKYLKHDAAKVVGVIGLREEKKQAQLVENLIIEVKSLGRNHITYEMALDMAHEMRLDPVHNVGRRTNAELLEDFMGEMEEIKERVEIVENKADVLGDGLVDLLVAASKTECWSQLPDPKKKVIEALSDDQRLRVDTAYAEAAAREESEANV